MELFYRNTFLVPGIEMSKACSTYPALECWQDRGMTITKRKGKHQRKIFAKLT
jgi:hypothetical protein